MVNCPGRYQPARNKTHKKKADSPISAFLLSEDNLIFVTHGHKVTGYYRSGSSESSIFSA